MSDQYRLITNERHSIEYLAKQLFRAGVRIIHPDVTNKNFPLKRRWFSTSREIAITLFSFDQNATSEEIESQMHLHGYRPARIDELIRFGAAFPYLLRNGPIFALGTLWRDDVGDDNVPYLDMLHTEPALRMYCISLHAGPFLAICRFAAVSEYDSK